MPPVLHLSSAAVFCAQLGGYVALSTALQRRFYHARAAERADWRAQPETPPHAPDAGDQARLSRRCRAHDAGPSDAFIAQWRWGLPALDLLFGRTAHSALPAGRSASQPAPLRRHPRHARFATVNLLLSAAFAAAVAEATSRGASALTWQPSHATPFALLCSLCACLLQQSVLEFYWHWAMHTPLLYRTLHAHHHYYKSPQPFDDLCIHPLEAFGYFCILYSPAMVNLVPFLGGAVCHVWAFLAYMSVCGVCGVLDHSGVRCRLALRLRLPSFGRGAPAAWLEVPIYDTEEHDAHHSCGFGGTTAVNLGFPFAVLDRLHGTYVAPDVARARRAALHGNGSARTAVK